jgi:hypothetical protein
VHKVAELERRIENLEKADLVRRLHKIDWKVYGLPRGVISRQRRRPGAL